MLKEISSRIISKLGREGYSLDISLRERELILILYEKTFEIIRGLLIKPLLGSSDGIIFIGRRCKILHKNHIHLGKTISIGDNVEINALSNQGIRIGNNFTIRRNSIIECTGVIRNLGEGLIIGNNMGIAQNCFIQVRGLVEIGNNVIIGPGVNIFSENHNYSNTEVFINQQGETRKGVCIGDGVWIGSGAIILDGVIIGENSIIAGGSVVNSNVPSWSIYGGVPAKLIKLRK